MKLNAPPVLDGNTPIRQQYLKAWESLRAQHLDRNSAAARAGYWNCQAAHNVLTDPKNNPNGKPAFEAFADYIKKSIDIAVRATSNIMNYGNTTLYGPNDVPMWYSTFRQKVTVYEGAPHGGVPSTHDAPSYMYDQIRPKNVNTEKIMLPVDAVELGNILTSEAYDRIVMEAAAQIDVKMRQDCWTLLGTAAAVSFGSVPVWDFDAAINTAIAITGNDYDWRSGQTDPFAGGTFAANGFTLAKMKALVSLNAGMLGNDGRPLAIRRIVVPAGGQLRSDIMGWAGSASTSGGVPEDILSEIWRGVWLFKPQAAEGSLPPMSVILEEDATISENYIWVFTSDPAFEFALWPGGTREWRRAPDFDDPDHYGVFYTAKYQVYMPSPYLGRWLRIRIR